ncbi:ArsR/SmtB family transcription factor [Halobaculum limi]|uniref:ArsR/SmtB family transcription factor n=1 Tax=Halobaculum limi TaxID=3031916 RepID=UPI0024076FBE|nr:helix-turn-helix transcriptional regulator [Halobaculum sp. YSMS11]
MTLETPPDWSTVFDALANAERRRVLVHLTDAPAEPVSPHDLAVVLTGDGPPDAVEEHLVRLRHVHLPKLEASGLTTTEDGGVVASQFAMALPTWSLDPTAGAVPDPVEFGLVQNERGAAGRSSGD